MKKINKNNFFSLLENKNLLFFSLILIFWWSFLGNVDFGRSDVFHDSDSDGLSDAEEYSIGTDISNPDTDGDGYRDGVEVEAGYDPLKPAPGDKIILQTEVVEEEEILKKEPEINLTDEFFDELVNQKNEEIDTLADYYNNPEKYDQEEDSFNQLNQLSLTSQEIQDLINQTTTNFELNEEMELISEDQIKILDETENKKQEKEQITQYLTQIFYVMAVNRPFSVEDPSALTQNLVNYINQINTSIQMGDEDTIKDLKENALKTYEECLEIETPEKTKDIHIRALSLVKYLSEDIKEDKLIDQKDPLTIALYVGKLQAAMIEGESLKKEIEEVLKEYEIEIFNDKSLQGIF